MTGRTRLAWAFLLCVVVACFLNTASARAGTPPISSIGDLWKATVQYVSSLWSNCEESGNCVDSTGDGWSNAEESGNCVNSDRDTWSNAEESGNCVAPSSDAASSAEELGS